MDSLYEFGSMEFSSAGSSPDFTDKCGGWYPVGLEVHDSHNEAAYSVGMDQEAVPDGFSSY